MDYNFDKNAHLATTTLKYDIMKSSNYNSLDNNNIGGVSIAVNTSPSGKYVYKNVSPPVANGFSFFNSTKTIFS